MKVVINRCFGGFGLSIAGVLEYARQSGFKIYPFTEQRDAEGHTDFEKFRAVSLDEKRPLMVHYSKSLLKVDGTYNEGDYFSDRDIPCNDPALITTVKKLGKKSWGMCAQLAIIEIPDDVEWEVAEYDGLEHIAEKHRTWR